MIQIKTPARARRLSNIAKDHAVFPPLIPKDWISAPGPACDPPGAEKIFSVISTAPLKCRAPVTEVIGSAENAGNMHLVIGVIERDGGTLLSAQDPLEDAAAFELRPPSEATANTD